VQAPCVGGPVPAGRAKEDTITDLGEVQLGADQTDSEPDALLDPEELDLEQGVRLDAHEDLDLEHDDALDLDDDVALDDDLDIGPGVALDHAQQRSGHRRRLEGDDRPPLDDGEEEDAEPLAQIDFEVGDSVVYPHHGAGKVLRKEEKEVLGERREYLTIKILHNDMTVMVPTANAALAGLRRVIDEETVQKVLAVLSDECSEMPKNWNRRYKHNRDKIKTGDIYELAEVVRNLAIRESQKGLSTGEKQMFTRARKILASELMYALEMDEEQVDEHLTKLLLNHRRPTNGRSQARSAQPSGEAAPSDGRAAA
jgi:CarD family transcriptional regulator